MIARPFRNALARATFGLALAGALAGSLVTVSCVSARADVESIDVGPEVVRSATRFRKEYVLAAGDQIEIHVRRFPEVSRTVMIRPDGMISLPLIDDVPAAGRTLRTLDDELTALLGQRLVDPEVTVIAMSIRQPVVFVTGDVTNNATVVPLRDAPTAMQAITFAGGLRRSAAARDVTIIRLAEDGHLLALPVSVEGGGQPAPALALSRTILAADDIIFVPESGRSQIARILDDFVNRPLAGLNAIVGTYVNFELVRELNQN